MKIKIILILALLIIILGIIFYTEINQAETQSNIDIIVVLKSETEGKGFWDMVNEGIEFASDEYNVNTKVMAPEFEKNINEQISIVKESIKEEPDVIILAANDYNKLVPISEKAVENGIKLITLDSDINSVESEGLVATNNYQAGIKASKALSEIINENKKIAIISHSKGSATAIDREKGVKSGLEELSFSNIKDTIYSDNSIEDTYTLTKELIESDNEIKGIIALNEPTSLGVAKAIDELNLDSKIKVVGFDCSIDEIKYIEKGIIKATVVQNPYNMGYTAVKNAVNIMNGYKMSRYIDTDSVIVNKENLYDPENEKLLFPFN
jgi:ribose transport system substrate-binding protein